MSSGWMAKLAAGMIIAAMVLVSIGVWVGKSYLEASAFNAATGKNVTTWQAMWVELRVQ